MKEFLLKVQLGLEKYIWMAGEILISWTSCFAVSV